MREISVLAVAELTGRNRVTVEKYITQKGIKPIRVEGRKRVFDSEELLSFKLMEKEAARPSSDIDWDTERARETKERADNLELKNAQLRRELIPVELMSWTLGNIGAQISAVLESIPVKLKRRMARLGASEVDIIKGEIAKCQNIAADIKVDFDEYENQS